MLVLKPKLYFVERFGEYLLPYSCATSSKSRFYHRKQRKNSLKARILYLFLRNYITFAAKTEIV